MRNKINYCSVIAVHISYVDTIAVQTESTPLCRKWSPHDAAQPRPRQKMEGDVRSGGGDDAAGGDDERF
eukprot:SAG22_NODE_11130_length_499_cov_0.892500_1_plen_68_part_01